MWTVLDLQVEDARQVLEHFQALGDDAVVHRFGTPRPPQALRDYVARMRWAQQEVLGVKHGPDLVGVAHLVRSPDGTAELGLSVLPKAQRQGIGRALLNACRQRAQAWNVHSIVLHHQRNNPAIVHLVREVIGPRVHRAHEAMLIVPVTKAQSA